MGERSANGAGKPPNGSILGGHQTADELFPLVYEQLRALARRLMDDEKAGHTLQPTALVHEVYLRLAGSGQSCWSDRTQFYFAAAEAMRRILIDSARTRAQVKRGGGRQRRSLNAMELASEGQIPQILALDEAILRLEEMSPTVAAVVRLRFYAGLTIPETAQVLGISQRTVKREWTYARAQLARELCDE